MAIGTVTSAAAPVIEPASRLRWRWTLVALGVLVGSVLAGVLLGAAGLPVRGVLVELVDRLPLVEVDSGLSAREQAILWELRVPRVVLGGLVGGVLAQSGAAFQGVFRNPLADPYLLGAAAGAGLGATLVIAYAPGATDLPVDPLPLAAFVGALAGVGLAYGVGSLAGAGTGSGTATLVLAGVAVAAFLTALQTFVQQREADTLQQVYTWILGRLSTSGWSEVLLILPYVLVSSAVVLAHGRLLDVLAVGDDEATALGVQAGRVRLAVVLAASLGTAAAVAVSGLIGFVGIIVPHLVRLVVSTSYRVVLPLSLIGGAAFLILTDLLARTAMAPAELPIGVVTAFFGAPFFALVLRTSKGGGT